MAIFPHPKQRKKNQLRDREFRPGTVFYVKIEGAIKDRSFYREQLGGTYFEPIVIELVTVSGRGAHFIK